MNIDDKIRYVKEYIRNEFGYEDDITNIHDVGLAYTTLSDEEIDIQVSIDLATMELKTWIGDQLCSGEPTEIEVVDDEFLKWLSFDDLISGWQTYIEDVYLPNIN